MADYYFPTVVRPSIPASAITPLELFLLCEMFEHEADGDALYFFSSEGAADTIYVDVKELKTLLDGSVSSSIAIVACIRKQLESVEDDSTEIDLDLSNLGEAVIFQDIVRRCEQLDHVTITSAWTCSKMRPDGFGGGITVVTADAILSASTSQMEGELLDRAEYGELGCAPGHGSHVLLRLAEADIRRAINTIVEADLPAGSAASRVTDADIRTACVRAVEAAPLAVHHDALATAAARAAIEIARQRSA